MITTFRGLPREVGVLVVVAFCVALGFGIVGPAIPLFARDFGATAFMSGAVISAFALSRLLFALPAGRLSDIIGERLVLSIGIGIVALSSALAGLSQSYGQLLALRGLGGIGSAMFTVSALTLLLRVSSPEQRGRSAAAFQGGFLLGGISGPFVGGLITAASIRAPFFIYAATLAAAGIVAAVFLARSPAARRDGKHDTDTDKSPEVESGFGPLMQALRNRSFVTASFVNLASGFTSFGLRASLVPLLVAEVIMRPPSLTGAGLTVSALVTAALLIPAGRVSDRQGRRPAMVLGTSAVVLSMIALAFTEAPPLFMIGMALLGVGSAFMGSAPAAVVGDVGGSRGGTVVAGFQMASDVGSIGGPLVAGFLVDAAGFEAAFLTGAIVSGIGLALSATMPETLRRDPRPETPAAAVIDD